MEPVAGDDDDEDFLDEPVPPAFEQVKMMDLEVVDSDAIRANYAELMADTENLFADLLDMDGVEDFYLDEGMAGAIADDMQYFDDLHYEFLLYEESLEPGSEPSSAGFITFLRDESQWPEEDIEYVEELAAELDDYDGIGFINDMQYAK